MKSFPKISISSKRLRNSGRKASRTDAITWSRTFGTITFSFSVNCHSNKYVYSCHLKYAQSDKAIGRYTFK